MKKTLIKNNDYSKYYPLAKYCDQQFISYLDYIYNIFQILDFIIKLKMIKGGRVL